MRYLRMRRANALFADNIAYELWIAVDDKKRGGFRSLEWKMHERTDELYRQRDDELVRALCHGGNS